MTLPVNDIPYKFWIHARDNAGTWGAVSELTFSCDDFNPPPPNNLTSSCLSDGKSVTLSWDPVFNSNYALRVDKNPSSWDDTVFTSGSAYDCYRVGTTNGVWYNGDFCQSEGLTSNSKTISIDPGVNYLWWIASVNKTSGVWSANSASPINAFCPGACSNLSYSSGNMNSASTNPGGTVLITCDYGSQVDSIWPTNFPGTCSWIGWSGTVANFSCIADPTPGTFPINCSLRSGTASNTCARTDLVGNLTISPAATCGNGVTEGTEQCDTGASRGSCPATCSLSCTNNSCAGPGPGQVCNNGIREGTEECDNGSSNGSCPSTCSSSCTINNCPINANGCCDGNATNKTYSFSPIGSLCSSSGSCSGVAAPSSSIKACGDSWCWTCPGVGTGTDDSCSAKKDLNWREVAI